MSDPVGSELYARAKSLIPGGVGLLSKRPEMFLPEQWPPYYAKASGAQVWDLSGSAYVDMIMAPGCFILGAADPDVNAAVHAAVDAGSFSTLNSPDEVALAELLGGGCGASPPSTGQHVRKLLGGSAKRVKGRLA